MSTKTLGNDGEELACEYLENKGYEILARNFTTKLGEVDIVALDEDEVVLVEVKTKKTAFFADPWVNVNRTKMGKVWRAGQVYLLQSGLSDRPVRIDVVSVILGSGKAEIEHFEDVFED